MVVIFFASLIRWSKHHQQTHRVNQFFYSLFFACFAVLTAAPAKAARLESWRFNSSQNQLEITTDGGVQPKAQLVADPTRLVIDLPGIVLGRPVINESMSGTVRSMRIGQFDRDTTRIVIELAPGYTLEPSQIKFRGISDRRWLIKLPTPQLATSSIPSISAVPRLSAPSRASESELAAIESVELNGSSNQLMIQANKPIRYTSRWDTSLAAYRIEISPAQLGNSVKGPELGAGSPISRVKLRQENSQTVAILVQPATGVQLGQMNQPNQRLVTLQIQRARLVSAAPAIAPRVMSVFNPSVANIPMPRSPNGRIVVIIDPGHGGPDPGAVGINGLQEKVIVLDIGNQVAALLQRQGVQALLTRADDRDLDLEPRVQMAEQSNATVFVSIHANAISLSRPDISGIETYYHESGLGLAQIIHQNVLQFTGASDRGVRKARFYVLRKTSMPSVLVEVGFVTGRDDASRLSNPAYRTQMADAIARGILQYLQRAARL
ncbi:MAG: N-acetylmuramoyl-L-alanine amidase [Leptolyngbya sp.]|nr:MAG: N-acetylmuramoyl-L-alanine amidase [Leptolyngbya sp.]